MNGDAKSKSTNSHTDKAWNDGEKAILRLKYAMVTSAQEFGD